MNKPDAKADERLFNDTLKRMLKTPPKPHDGQKTVSAKIQKPTKKAENP